jgi:hypothetical protein
LVFVIPEYAQRCEIKPVKSQTVKYERWFSRGRGA